MEGILLSRPITYLHASFRAFREGEYHITRRAEHDVLILMQEGTLTFTEDGEQVRLVAGDYYIQRRGGMQSATEPSVRPRYLYVHFLAAWGEEAGALPRRGRFSVTTLAPLLEEMDTLGHAEASYIARCGVLYRILTEISAKKPSGDIAEEICAAIEAAFPVGVPLPVLAERFHFGRNHLINLFRRRYGVTPVAYTNRLRLARARYLLEVTSDSLEAVAEASGFSQYSHFYRLFLRETGCSPSAYRASRR